MLNIHAKFHLPSKCQTQVIVPESLHSVKWLNFSNLAQCLTRLRYSHLPCCVRIS